MAKTNVTTHSFITGILGAEAIHRLPPALCVQGARGGSALAFPGKWGVRVADVEQISDACVRAEFSVRCLVEISSQDGVSQGEDSACDYETSYQEITFRPWEIDSGDETSKPNEFLEQWLPPHEVVSLVARFACLSDDQEEHSEGSSKISIAMKSFSFTLTFA